MREQVGILITEYTFACVRDHLTHRSAAEVAQALPAPVGDSQSSEAPNAPTATTTTPTTTSTATITTATTTSTSTTTAASARATMGPLLNAASGPSERVPVAMCARRMDLVRVKGREQPIWLYELYSAGDLEVRDGAGIRACTSYDARYAHSFCLSFSWLAC